jgi:hypothetical protein
MTEINTPGGTISQQLGATNVYIDKFLPLNINLKSALDPKLSEIFEMLKTRENISRNHRDILKDAIDLCRCSEYKHSRILWGLTDREVRKTTHPKHV